MYHARGECGAGAAGLNFADLAGDDVSNDAHTRTGFLFGGVLNLGLSETLALQTELVYVQKGARSGTSVAGFGITETLSFNYLEVPVLLRVAVPMSESTRFFLLAGPALAYNVSAKASISAFGESASEDVADNVKDFDGPHQHRR